MPLNLHQITANREPLSFDNADKTNADIKRMWLTIAQLPLHNEEQNTR